MRHIFTQNPFSLFLMPETAAIADGLKENVHYACEFEPGGGGSLFADHLAERLGGGERLLFRANLQMATGGEHLVKLLTRSFVHTFAGDLLRIEAALKKLIPTATPRLVMDENPHVDIDYGTDPRKIFANLLDLPEMMGGEERRGATVIWNGFGRIEEILGSEGSRLFAAKVKGQAITSHVMIGSGMVKTAQKVDGSMSGRVRTLRGTELVPREALEAGLIRIFAKEGLTLKSETAAAIVQLADGKLETAQTIVRALGRDWGTAAPHPAALDRAVDDILADAAAAYEQVWELLNLRQRGVLYGLTRTGDRSLYSEWFIKEFGFKTATNLQAAIRALDAKGILHKRGRQWVFADPLFALWIQRRGG